MLHLEGEDWFKAEASLYRAAEVNVDRLKNEDLSLRYKSSFARTLDMKGISPHSHSS